MPIHDAAYNGSPCALQVLASSAISLAKFAAPVSMITWRRRASAARGIVRRLTITTSVHEPAASKARTSPDPTCPVPPTTKTRKPMLCLSPSNIAGVFLSAILLPHTIPIDCHPKAEAKAHRSPFDLATMGEKWQRHADHGIDPEHHGNLDSKFDKNQRTDADRQHETEIIPRCAGMHHRIGAKLRPWQVVSATCGLSFPR